MDLSHWCQSRRGKGAGRHIVAPLSDLGPWDGARVGSHRCPPPRSPKLYHTEKRRRHYPERFANGCSIRACLTATRDPSPLSQLESDRGCGGLILSQPARRVEWSGHRVRNSHQINLHLPRPGRASHGPRERYLAKECVGSNRALKRTIATSRRDDNLNKANQTITQ
jgi:hypothetical protein